jgi:hypothetical protein
MNMPQRAMYQIMEIYPNANMVKMEYKDQFFTATIFDKNMSQHVEVRAEIVDLKFYVSFRELECH